MSRRGPNPEPESRERRVIATGQQTIPAYGVGVVTDPFNYSVPSEAEQIVPVPA
jgi:hypothetical protein